MSINKRDKMVEKDIKSRPIRGFMLVLGGRRAYFGSKGRPLSPASAYLELLSQNISSWDIYLGIERFEIDPTQTDLDLTQTRGRGFY